MTAERLGPNFPSGIKRVHVGCGPHAIMPDWWNVDIRKFRGIDEIINATEPWPYADLDFIFAEHFIEHLTLEQGLKFLIHAGNSLRLGGVLRLSTPNLEWVVHTHFKTGQVEPAKRVLDTLWINRAFHGWGHQVLYSKELLVHLLQKVGYEKITACQYGQSTHPELNDLEKHGKFSVTGGFPSVVIVEATRGPILLDLPSDLAAYLEENYLRYVASGH
jgi:predicted SAM-dependent methyltransferase